MRLKKSFLLYFPVVLLMILVSCGSIFKTAYIPDTSSDLRFVARDSEGDVVLERSNRPVWDWEQIDLIECTVEPILMREEKHLKVRVTTSKPVVWGRKFPKQVDYYEFIVLIKPQMIGPHQLSVVVRVSLFGPRTDLFAQNMDGRTINKNPVLLRCDWEDNYFDLFIPNYILDRYYLLPDFKVQVDARMKVKEEYKGDLDGESYLLDVLLSESPETGE